MNLLRYSTLMKRLSFDKGKMKVLLLEGINPAVVQMLQQDGYTNIEVAKRAYTEEELLKIIGDVHVLGVRSRTQATKKILGEAKKLLTIGCFCIGTDQVDLHAAKLVGIPVFNAPFSNTRSVAELVIGYIIHLLRRIPEKSAAAHTGQWLKSAEGCFEVRGKKLGIIGYGHIGTQLGILAETLGMQVAFFDTAKKLPLGNAHPSASLKELLGWADVVSLHVPEDRSTEKMMNAKTIGQMKAGSYLINASRGKVVDIDALADALKSNHIAGAAIDVFPQEPKSADEEFVSPLRAFQNVILTPHIGGSTQEAQENIGREVTEKLLTYINNGSTVLSVNFVEVNLPQHEGKHRILHIHKNISGVIAAVTNALSSKSINISGQYLQTDTDIGYAIFDTDETVSKGVLEELKGIPHTMRARVLY